MRNQFCNGIQLNRVLPSGPRDYWVELAAEHKNAPEHMQWMYDADPFAARRAVDERQAKAAKNRQEGNPKDSKTQASQEFAHAPEVRMASELRDMVEDVVKKVIEFRNFSRVDIVIDENRRQMRCTLMVILYRLYCPRRSYQLLPNSSVT